jgi:hypothetical protein
MGSAFGNKPPPISVYSTGGDPMKKAACGALVLLLMGLLFVGAALADGGAWTEVIDGQSADRVHLRAAPSTQADSLGLYFTGTPVTVLGRIGGFTQVRIGSAQGFIMSRYLLGIDEAAHLGARWPLGLINNPGGGFVNLRAYPSEAGTEVLGTVENGVLVQIWGETADHWYYVSDGTSGQMGYMMASLVLPVDDAYDAAYRRVLFEDMPFFGMEERRELRLSDLRRGDVGMTFTTPAFSRIDLNGDGQIEVVIQVESEIGAYGVQVLYQWNGTVYGQFFGLRAMGGLKFDGSYHFASNAAESGIGRLRIDGAQCIPTQITYSEMVSDAHPMEIRYFVDNQPGDAAGFEEAVSRWAAQREAVWVPLL